MLVAAPRGSPATCWPRAGAETARLTFVACLLHVVLLFGAEVLINPLPALRWGRAAVRPQTSTRHVRVSRAAVTRRHKFRGVNSTKKQPYFYGSGGRRSRSQAGLHFFPRPQGRLFPRLFGF